jgi:hypothetical protein
LQRRSTRTIPIADLVAAASFWRPAAKLNLFFKSPMYECFSYGNSAPEWIPG